MDNFLPTTQHTGNKKNRQHKIEKGKQKYSRIKCLWTKSFMISMIGTIPTFFQTLERFKSFLWKRRIINKQVELWAKMALLCSQIMQRVINKPELLGMSTFYILKCLFRKNFELGIFTRKPEHLWTLNIMEIVFI